MEYSNLVEIVKDTINQYYNMSEDQRSFMKSIVMTRKVKWKRQELIKTLLIYNKACDINCTVVDGQMKCFIEDIDRQSVMLNNIINKYDIEFRESNGVFD